MSMNLTRRQCLRRAGAVGVVGLTGCTTMSPPTTIPIHVLRPGGGRCAGRAPVLLVMLPGAWSRPPEFIDEGFVAAVRSRGIAADIAIADAHLGYFNDRSVLTRLREDVVQPARAQGYQQIWLVGISLGGFAALGYAARYEDEIDGLVVLAPYLGRRQLLDEIDAAGGPMAWRNSPHAPPTDEEPERSVWEWLTARAAAPAAPATTRLPVFLGHGDADRFVAAHRLLAGVLPAGRSVAVPGGHDWTPWRALWSQWLDRGLLPSDCPGAAADSAAA
jgi:pimeloyl-ACP methyl ester carboxylesterase